jgi:predicted transposase YbfD/YdcC
LPLLSLNRRPWSIEICLHYARNLAFDEDRCRIREHAGAQVVASPRKLARSLLRLIFELLGLS